MSVSKKDFQAIARAIYRATHPQPAGDRDLCPIAASYPCGWYGKRCRNHYTDADRITEALTDVLTASNPRFDRAQFIEACETGRCKGMAR